MGSAFPPNLTAVSLTVFEILHPKVWTLTHFFSESTPYFLLRLVFRDPINIPEGPAKYEWDSVLGCRDFRQLHVIQNDYISDVSTINGVALCCRRTPPHLAWSESLGRAADGVWRAGRCLGWRRIGWMHRKRKFKNLNFDPRPDPWRQKSEKISRHSQRRFRTACQIWLL